MARRLFLLLIFMLPVGCAGDNEPVESGGDIAIDVIEPTEAPEPTVVPIPTATASPVAGCNTTPPDDISLSRDIPCQAELDPPFTLENLQHGFDVYSWKTFAALNAPAGSDGVIGPDVQTVWETWREPFSIFLPGGATPPPWGTSEQTPAACAGVAAEGNGMKLLRMVGKTPDVLTAFDQPFDTGPLIDQNGRYTRYEIIVNESMFNYIVNNTLYNTQGQSAFGDVDFPAGSDTVGVGAIMAKAAWRVIDESEKDRFHTAEALIYTPASEDPPIQESCTKELVGLVGLHIAHKTAAEPQWLWSTFEHVDNSPSQAVIERGDTLKSAYNYYNPDCSQDNCPWNQPPPHPWDPNVEPFPNGFTSQVVRIISITEDTQNLNKEFQALLAGTVWENYMLISTQWPTDASSPTDPTGAPAPQFLANTTLETYIQGEVPLASSSCIDCHNNATTTQGTFSDFTYVLELAQPVPSE